MDEQRRKGLERLANEKANMLFWGDVTPIEDEIATLQINMAIKRGIPEEYPEDEEPSEPPPDDIPPATPEEKEIYYRKIITSLADHGQKARAALLDIAKYLFNLSPEETADFFLERSGGGFGIVVYSSLTDAIRKLSKLPEAVAITEAIKAKYSAPIAGKRAYRRGAITQENAVAILATEGIRITTRQLRNWIYGTNTPKGFPWPSDAITLKAWAADFDRKERLNTRVINMAEDEMSRKRRK